MLITQVGGGCGVDLLGSGQGPVAGSCECGDKPSGIYCRVKLSTNVSEVRTAYIIRDETSETSVNNNFTRSISQKTTLNIILAAVRT
jgi:hypothetical protein